MSTEIEQMGPLVFVGDSTTTSFAQETSEETANIPGAWQDFFLDDRGELIKNSVDPNKVYGVYTDYESDFKGRYTLVIGSLVKSANFVPEGMVVKKLPASKYQVFKSPPGLVTEVVPNLWQIIWKTTEKAGNPKRTYTGDFEVYNLNSFDPFNCQLTIYIAVE